MVPRSAQLRMPPASTRLCTWAVSVELVGVDRDAQNETTAVPRNTRVAKCLEA